MNVLVINAGSSSLKYQLLHVESHTLLAKGICERVGFEGSFHKYGLREYERINKVAIPNHTAAMKLVIESLLTGEDKAIDSLGDIKAIGHRVVQGGKYFKCSVLVDENVISKIDELAELAPLHNKAALEGIFACQKLMPYTPMVAVFDTSFFATLPPKAYIYPLPYELYEKHDIRKYGAHGTSHRYLAERAAAFVNQPIDRLKMVTCHLGNGCSVTAIDGGVAVDTSMGLTPLDGLMMGTRCGAIDPAIVTFLIDRVGMTAHEANDLMNKRSGLLGVSGISNDLRMVQEAAENGNAQAQLALDMYVSSVKKHLGSYSAVMGGIDVIVLSAGVGENSEYMRHMIFEGLEPLGMKLDERRNHAGHGTEREISSDDSQVRILVIPTNEEYMIARDTYDIVREYN